MKKVFILSLIVLATFCVVAQENSPKLYLLFEFMQVNDENNSDYWEVEDFWSGIHKQRVANNEIIGWDLWTLTPSGTMQGSQFLTVTLFSGLQDMLEGMNMEGFNDYAKKAHPSLSDKEISDMMEKTASSRDIAHQVYFEQIDFTKDDFEMKVGTIATIDVMKQKNDQYEKIESEIFKPWHQEMVDAGEKENWGLLRAILPMGSETYGTHLTVSMYKDVNQFVNFMENSGGDMDLLTELATKDGLKSRDWKEVKLAKLVKLVR